MSKKKRKHPFKLKVGHFYNVHDGSPGGHPGQIYNADYINDLYISIVFGSTEAGRNRKMKDHVVLTIPISTNVETSLVHKRPFLGTRDDYGDKEYQSMSIKKTDYSRVNKIKTRRLRLGKYYKRKK